MTAVFHWCETIELRACTCFWVIKCTDDLDLVGGFWEAPRLRRANSAKSEILHVAFLQLVTTPGLTAMCVNIKLLLIKFISGTCSKEKFIRSGVYMKWKKNPWITAHFYNDAIYDYNSQNLHFFTILVGRPTWYVISTILCEYMFPNGKTYEFI